MIYRLIILMIAISIVDLRNIKKEGQKKDTYFYIGSMAIAAMVGTLYFSNENQPSIVEGIFNIMNVKW